MKNNKEVAASVFAKSRIVLQERARRRKRIAAAASTLGAAAIITFLAFLGNGAFSGGVPTAQQQSSKITSSAAKEADTSRKTPRDETGESSSSSVSSASSSPSGKSGSKKSGSEKDTSHKAESRRTSSNSSKSPSSASSARAPSAGSSSSGGGEERSSAEENSRTSGSKPSSSKTTSSRTTSSKTTSSRATSSGTISSRVTSSKPSSSRTVSSTPSSSTVSSTPDKHNSSTRSAAENDTDTNAFLPEADTDTPQVHDQDGEIPNSPEAPQTTFQGVDYVGRTYTSAEELVNAADSIVIARIEDIGFERMTAKTAYLKDNIEMFDSPQEEAPNAKAGDIITVYRVNVTKGLKDFDISQGDDAENLLEFRVYGGSNTADAQVQEEICGSTIPLVFNMDDLAVGETYLFLLDEGGSVTTLVSLPQGTYSEDHPFDTDACGISYESIMEALER